MASAEATQPLQHMAIFRMFGHCAHEGLVARLPEPASKWGAHKCDSSIAAQVCDKLS